MNKLNILLFTIVGALIAFNVFAFLGTNQSESDDYIRTRLELQK